MDVFFSMLLGALLLLLGGSIGYRQGQRVREQKKNGPLECSCGHLRSMHRMEKGKVTGSCAVVIDKIYDNFECACLRYDGPVPPEEVIRDFDSFLKTPQSKENS